jgi:two-component system, OmpR family, phosphate regulon sensor histidine kinase PhoR
MSIRKKLTLLMLAIGLLPTLVVSVLAYITISNGLTRKTADQLISSATKQEQRINALLQKRQEEAIELSNKFDLQTALGSYLASSGKQGEEALHTILLDKKVSTPDIQTIHLADLDGTVIASTLRTSEGTQLSAQDTSMAEGQETSTTVREDPRDGIDKLYITTKLNVNKNESGLLSVIFRIDDIVAAVQDYTGLGSTGETVVAVKDKDGNAQSLFPLRFDTDAALNKNLNSLQLFSQFNNGYKDLTDYRGQPVMVAAKSIGFADWVIATKIDRAEALAQIDQLGNALVVIVVLSSAAIIVIALYFTRFFTKPILHIAQAAQRIGKGDFSAKVDLRRNDEIGTLGSSINAMGISLRDFVASIEAQRHRLEIILNSITESILAIDKHGRILIANQAAAGLTGVPQQEIVGKMVADIFPWTKAGKLFEINYAQDGARTYSELQYTNSAGAVHHVKLIVAKVSGQREQEAAQTIVTIHDETKSRELEAMKVDFVSMAAHELRTPLAAIRGYLELITFKSGSALAVETNKYLSQALKSTSELGGLINNLLDVTRIERGTLTFNLEKVDIAADIKQAVQDARFTAHDKRIALEYAGPSADCFVIADQIALREVVNNLISNAIKYTDTGGKVSVTLVSDGHEYEVSIHDTGVGIPKQAQANLFTKFYRVHGGLNSENTGTGLGLFISKSIIERHGGSIHVSSQAGVGSVFSFRMPMFDEARFTALQTERQPKIIATRRRHGWITKNIAR